MRIAQIAPLAEAVPPRFYGGTERVVSTLTEELVALGHQVTLFASGGSADFGRACTLRPAGSAAVRHPRPHGQPPRHARYARPARGRIRHHPLPRRPAAARPVPGPRAQVRHDPPRPARLPDLPRVYETFPEMPLVSISNSQRAPLPASVNWLATLPHGINPEICPFHPQGGDYLAFLGRISPEKRPDRAIEIAKRAGAPLKIAAKVDPADKVYFEEEIAPLLDHPLVEFIGEIDEHQKARLPGPRPRPPVPDRLAGTIRPRHDGSHVGRNARGRLAQRVGSGDHRRRRVGRYRRVHRGSCRRRRSSGCARPGRREAALRAALHGIPHGGRLRGRI